ncbi:MAG: segregation/condensation protein A [Acidobacteriota bacterium]|nr:segregation/condensation protein A [Acidobacteriota bacterium]
MSENTSNPRPEIFAPPVDAPPPTGLEVSLPQFEGPLDLLLHLVRSQGIDILDIPITEIASQYNAYLDQMRELDLEVASEYLVMAATLAHIKSRMLLPPDPAEEGAEDPRLELAMQLLEYEKYQKAAEALGVLETSRELMFVRNAPPPEELAGVMTLEVDLDQLVGAFEKVLARLESEDLNQVIRRENFKIHDMMARILASLEQDGRASFRDLVEACRTRLERIVLFLGLLELVRLGNVTAQQAGWRTEILIRRRHDRPAEAPGAAVDGDE